MTNHITQLLTYYVNDYVTNYVVQLLTWLYPGDAEGEDVQMGIECDDENGTKTMYDQGSHVITGLNVKCKVSHWILRIKIKIDLSSFVEVTSRRPVICTCPRLCTGTSLNAKHQFQFNWLSQPTATKIQTLELTWKNAYQNGSNRDWAWVPRVLSILVGIKHLRKSSYKIKIIIPFLRPWYFITQNWPNSGCAYGCGSDKNLKQIHEQIDTCYKVQGTEMPKCGGPPPLTALEQSAGTDAK